MILNEKDIPNFTNELSIPAVFTPEIITDPVTGKVISHNYVITVDTFMQQVLPQGFPQTMLLGYGGMACNYGKKCNKNTISSPAPTIIATRGIPVNIKWINNLANRNPFPVDPTIHWADPNNIGMIDDPSQVPDFPPGLNAAQQPMPITTHLHGGENSSVFDGQPSSWFTKDEEIIGPTFVTSTTQYPNTQPSTNLWYHDHVLGLTRLNVHLGLVGLYIIKDYDNPLDGISSVLPQPCYDIPLAIQDATFNDDGSLYYPSTGVNPDIHPYWIPEFFGNTIMVNGRVWPNLDVKRHVYRFRVVNTSNARFFTLNFSNGMSFVQIGSDGGYLEKPVTLTNLIMAPSERADILVDFSAITPHTTITLQNTAPTPYPTGSLPDPSTTGVVMQFTISPSSKKPSKPLPPILNTIPTLVPNANKRTLVLVEVEGADGPLEVLLDGQSYTSPATETPLVGSTEEWELVNLTMDTHPIHLHLVQFLAKNRQEFNVDAYSSEWQAQNGTPPLNHPTVVVPVDDYLIGSPIPPDENESGWKDTLRMNPGQVTRILVRFAPQDADESKVRPGVNLFPFNPSIGPGYVWHCHILEHEDNEMMRPLIIRS